VTNSKYPPHIPSIRVLEDEDVDVEEEDGEDDVRARQEIMTENGIKFISPLICKFFSLVVSNIII
jgi:hypothetical protein